MQCCCLLLLLVVGVVSWRGRSRPPHIRYGYCQKPGHPKSDCYKKMLDMGRASPNGTRPPPSSHSFSEQDIAVLKSILPTSGSSSPIGTAGSVTVISRTK
jgi:hypothetical protein